MTYRDLAIQIVEAANNQDQDELSRLIIESDFYNDEICQGAALRGFIITKDNISKHMPAAKKLVEKCNSGGLVSGFRVHLLSEFISDIEVNQ